MVFILEDDHTEQIQINIDQGDYSATKTQYAPVISELINNNQFTNVLDYGSGEGKLMHALKVDHTTQVRCYDPNIEQFARKPEPSEFVVCIDVLTHIKPERIDNTLDHLQSLTQKLAIVTIHQSTPNNVFSNRNNAHLTQESTSWWLDKIIDRFELEHLVQIEHGILLLLLPKQRAELSE